MGRQQAYSAGGWGGGDANAHCGERALELVQLQLLGTASIHQLGEHLLEQWLRHVGEVADILDAVCLKGRGEPGAKTSATLVEPLSYADGLIGRDSGIQGGS